ncbi:MAG: glycosyltransferase [Magnetococcales bacterium]|nr:glycosyltransferase [Magnetococcales bacterium]
MAMLTNAGKNATDPFHLTVNARVEQVLESHFLSNMNLLSVHSPEIYRAVVDYRGPRGQSWDVVIKEGQFQDIRVWLSDGRQVEMKEQQILAQLVRDAREMSETTISLVVGVGIGHVLLWIYDKTRRPHRELKTLKVPVFVMEPDISQFIVFLHIHDLRDLILSGRVLFFVGENARGQMMDYYRVSTNRYPNLILHEINVEKTFVSDIIKQVETQFHAQHKVEVVERYTMLRDFYQSRPVEAWRDIFSEKRNRPLRVMGMTSIHTSFLQYCMRDLLKGFRDIGCETDCLIEPDELAGLTNLHVLEKLEAFKPDFLVLLDHFRWENPIVPEGVPLVSWIQDLLSNVREPSDNRLGPWDVVCSFSQSWIKEGHFENNPMFNGRTTHFLPISANVDIYRPLPEANQDIDVLYVSHVTPPEKRLCHIQQGTGLEKLEYAERVVLEKLSWQVSDLEAFYQKIYGVVEAFPLGRHHEILKDPKQREAFKDQMIALTGVKDRDAIHQLLIGDPVPSRVTIHMNTNNKIKPMRYLAEKGVAVKTFGNNWNLVPGMAQAAQGPAQNGEPLNALINRSKICINNSSGTTFHMWALEVMAAGGFLLTRRIAPELDNTRLTDYFEEGSEVVFFDDEKDLLEKVNYYLEHEQERKEIAQRVCEKVRAHHSYANCAQRIIELTTDEVHAISDDWQTELTSS